MSDPLDLSHSQAVLRPAFRALPPPAFPPVEADLPGRPEGVLRLNLNEAFDGPSPLVAAAVADAVRNLNRYPDPRGRALTAALAMRVGIPPGRVVLGNGSDELIQLVMTIALDAGERAVLPMPSFGRYFAAVRSLGAVAVPVRLRADGACDVSAMVEAARQGAKIVMIATPNNPTGGMLQAGDLARLAADVPERTLLVIDEAYFEFAQAEAGIDALAELSARQGPWIVLRTLSKAYGLAGARIGYAIAGDETLADGLHHARGVFNVNALAQAAGLAALADPAHMRRIVERTIAERERLRRALDGMGLSCLPSAANFLAVALPLPSGKAIQTFSDRGILVGAVGGPPFERYIRITIGAPGENDRAVEAIRELLAAA